MSLKKLTESTRWILLLALSQFVILTYYWLEWRTFTDFVQAIDHGPRFMQDFISHYYPMGEQILQNPKPVPGYFYTSFFANILAAISAHKTAAALTIWAAIQIICVIALCACSISLLKMTPLGSVLYISLCTASFPILHNIKWGQVSVLIILCVVTAFIESKKNKSILAGMLLGLATTIKLYPAYFIIYFIIKRDVRTPVAFGLSVFIFFFALPATIIGAHNWFEFERLAVSAVINADWVSQDPNSQYIVHVGRRLIESISGQATGENISGVLRVSGYMIALSSIAIIWRLQRSSIPEKLDLSLVTLFLITPFILKTSWPHYFAYLPLCQVATLGFLATNHSQPKIWRGTLYSLPIASMLLSSTLIFNLFPGYAKYNSYGMLFLANLLLLVCVLIILSQQGVKLTGESLR